LWKTENWYAFPEELHIGTDGKSLVRIATIVDDGTAIAEMPFVCIYWEGKAFPSALLRARLPFLAGTPRNAPKTLANRLHSAEPSLPFARSLRSSSAALRPLPLRRSVEMQTVHLPLSPPAVEFPDTVLRTVSS
jgi:hypothetical protein